MTVMKETKTKKGVVDGARVDNGDSLIVAFYSNVVNNRAARCCPLGNRPMMRWWIDLPASISSVEVRGGVLLVSCCWKSYPVRSSSTERRACFECGMKEVKNVDDRKDLHFYVLIASCPILEEFYSPTLDVSPNTCIGCQAICK